MHAVRGGSHRAPQTPPLQTSPGPHAIPQPPQFAASDAVSAHVAPQRICPVRHAHAPAVHEAPPVHAMPQRPQFKLSVEVSTHVPEHPVWPIGQDTSDASGSVPSIEESSEPSNAPSIRASGVERPVSRGISAVAHAARTVAATSQGRIDRAWTDIETSSRNSRKQSRGMRTNDFVHNITCGRWG